MENSKSQSHYLIFKYYDRWYLYARGDNPQTAKKALNSAYYLGAEAFKQIYNSSMRVNNIKSDIQKNAKTTWYENYDQYIEAMKQIPLARQIIL